ncbi:RING/U-box superfamily protein [Raphanus sativus]|uniref:RBR-type E3 ubiquitin transferase n=1 Tax=Raphanus sativus TaxID=3726 RepID=A0A9W3CQW1_RAPSA|nr:E3 ubiquitin-protein ligase RSL1-like [Raphanus sativus]KAJ4870719.1 RING/U-box superfamily protein [Raphanus sativus]
MGTCFSSSSSSSSSRTRMEDYHYNPALYNYVDEVYQPYAWDLHLQEALSSSSVSSTSEANHYHQLHSHIATRINQEEPKIKPDNKPAEPSKTLCMICMDEKSPTDIFRGTTGCTHHYCTECTARYVTTMIEENIAMIKCPDVDCARLLEPYTCRDIIPGDVFERWDKSLCESLILSSEKVYCPFEDCSAMMVVDDDEQGDEVRETECPSCHRLFCAQCKATWHAGIWCEEFQRSGNARKKKKNSDEEDAMLIQMAKNKQWRRCPSCKFYVEKIDGCIHMRCRCRFHFCYRCGAAWSLTHACHIRSRLLSYGLPGSAYF